jgi:phosphohistidine phosphatase
MLAEMKKLLILRHAKAETHDGPIQDHERELTKKGRKAAEHVGELLKERALVPDRVLSSTAERARVTAELAARAAGYTGTIEALYELYLAEPPAYLDALRRLGESSCVLVVGHNPGIETLIYRLAGQPEHMPTAALAECNLPLEKWSDLANDTQAELVNVFRPKEAK